MRTKRKLLILNDLEGLYPDDKRVLFFPASYRVPYQLEETDNANVVTRAEVLERISGGANAWIVTYPEALFEKVPTQKNLVKNTLRVELGKIIALISSMNCYWSINSNV